MGGVLPESQAARTFLGRWVRRGILAGFGVAFTVPYLSILDDVHAEGDELLPELPRRIVVFLANHQTYFMEALAFFDLVYVRHQFPLEDPMVRLSAAEETMKKNLLTSLMALAGGVTLKRSFREGGVDVQRPVDLDGVRRVRDAIRDGWLLHFPAGTTKKGAPLRAGVARLLHQTRATAVPVRVDGVRDLLLHKQMPGRLFKSLSLHIHPVMELDGFYSGPYTKASGQRVLTSLESRIGDPEAGSPSPFSTYSYVRPHDCLEGMTPIEVDDGIRGHLLTPVSPTRGWPADPEPQIPFDFVFLDPENRAFPLLLPGSA